MGMKEAYIEKLEAQLKEWSASLDGLKAKADKAGADAKIEYEKKLQELRPKYATAQKKIEEVKSASAEAWEGVKNAAEKAWTDIRTSFEKVR